METRGYGSQERTIQPILMADQEADSLLVVEVLTPGGNWSSYPPHKHDHDNPPAETLPGGDLLPPRHARLRVRAPTGLQSGPVT